MRTPHGKAPLGTRNHRVAFSKCSNDAGELDDPAQPDCVVGSKECDIREHPEGEVAEGWLSRHLGLVGIKNGAKAAQHAGRGIMVRISDQTSAIDQTRHSTVTASSCPSFPPWSSSFCNIYLFL